jgi:hypothetical protein
MFLCTGFQKLLSPQGLCYMVAVEENRPKDLIRILRTYGLETQVSSYKSRHTYIFFVLLCQLMFPQMFRNIIFSDVLKCTGCD